MTAPALVSRRDAPEAIATILSNSSGLTDSQLRLEVQEDKCFPGSWLAIGRIAVHPEPVNAHPQQLEPATLVARALRHGFFEWEIPEKDTLLAQVIRFFESRKSLTDRQEHKIDEAIKEVAHIAIRCGIAYPALDPLAISVMPYSRPVSVVVDTSAIVQGGLDFVARELAPQARIKVPAIVHMEILNLVDRYFSQRNRGKPSPAMLFDHVMSQGAHRALLRLAIDPRIEIERSRLGSDPLRGVVQPDSDAEDKSLGLHVVQRSFADRLILETAIQHRDAVNPDHDVILLTSDQGLARMALAEGIQPLFCDANATNEIFGSTLTGVVFVPFLRDATRLSYCSLPDILWESATSFGSARLVGDQTGATYTVTALQSTVPWKLHHSLDDLLWAEVGSRSAPPTDHATRTPPQPSPDPAPSGQDTNQPPSPAAIPSSSPSRPPRASATRPTRSRRRGHGTYAFRLSSMLDLLSTLSEKGSISDAEAMSCANVKSKSAYGEYYNFLGAGGFATRDRDQLQKTPAMEELIGALRIPDHGALSHSLQEVPSFASFVRNLELAVPLSQVDARLRQDAFRTYAGLAELACIGIRIHGQGVYATPYNPTPAQFVEPALSAFDAVRRGERFALTGAWLEHLATVHGIHPIHVRQRLAEAHQAGYVQRFFEGSTPETRFQGRFIACLEGTQGRLAVRMTNLYYGDFLLPGRASVSIRLSVGANS